MADAHWQQEPKTHDFAAASVPKVAPEKRKNISLTIADGYHRICAGYHLAEDEPVACRIVVP